MAKGVSVKFKSYKETIPVLLKVLKFDQEIKKHSSIILKPYLKDPQSTPISFVEAVLRFCLENKNPEAKVFIAEGADGADTIDLFDSIGYKKLSEHYSVGLIDLNEAEVEDIQDADFLKFDNIKYPKILLESFVVSLPKITDDPEFVMAGALSNMLGAFPANYYKGLFTSGKSKIRKWPIKFSIHDILVCKVPDFAIIDASEQGLIFAGKPFEADQQAAKAIGKDWRTVPYLRLFEDSIAGRVPKQLASANPNQ